MCGGLRMRRVEEGGEINMKGEEEEISGKCTSCGKASVS